MSLRKLVLFREDGKGTQHFFGQWRRKAPLRPIQSRAVLVDGGLATRYFRELWTVAFPTRERMPDDPIANKDGTGTDRFWDVFD